MGTRCSLHPLHLLHSLQLGALALLLATVACGSTPTVQASQASQDASADIDPAVDAMVRAFSDRLSQVKGFRLRVHDTVDVIEENGQSVQYAHVREAVIRRPDRAWAHTWGDLVDRTIWKDGQSVTLFDSEEMIYARIDDPGTIEQMIDVLYDRYGFSTPMADVLSDDPYEILMEGVTSARHLGEHLVGEEPCHHIAVEHPDVDWQLWLSTGEVPRLRKLVITHKHEPGSPRFSMVVKHFEVLQDVPESLFAAELPEDAEEIEIIPLDELDEDQR